MLATAPQPPVRQFVTAPRHLFVTCHSTYRRGKACLDHDEDDDDHHDHTDHHCEHDDGHTFKDRRKVQDPRLCPPSFQFCNWERKRAKGKSDRTAVRVSIIECINLFSAGPVIDSVKHGTDSCCTGMTTLS